MAPSLLFHLTDALDLCFGRGSVLPARHTAVPVTKAATALKKCVFS